jgi:NADH-quinone oxidoreductase subunit H
MAPATDSTLPLAVDPTLADFGHDPWWLILIKVLFAFIFGAIGTVLGVWFERRVVARMAVRPGPNQAGPFGLLQTLFDGIKGMLKEDLLPRAADKFVFFFAPTIPAIFALTSLAVIPFGPVVSIFGHTTALQVTDVPVAVLITLACSAVGVYGIVLGGWASGSTYPLLGGLRSSAQVISYEVAMGLSIVAVFMSAGTMSTSGIVAAQAGGGSASFFGWNPGWLHWPAWYAILLLPSFVIFVISAFGETNRAPFDLPEAESELVAGYMTEYSSIKFLLYMLSEYVAMLSMSAATVTLFLGGWRAPWPISIWDGANEGWLPLLWFFLKVVLLLFVFIWVRATLPRLRYDQFMRFGWKVLLPINLLWILLLGAVRTARGDVDSSTRTLLIAGVVVTVLLLAVIWASRKPPAKERTLAEQVASRPTGSFPLPPLDLTVPPSPRARQIVAGRTPANVSGVIEGSATTSGEES